MEQEGHRNQDKNISQTDQAPRKINILNLSETPRISQVHRAESLIRCEGMAFVWGIH